MSLHNFDAIVVGSGFGGAVMACRLAETGYQVLVLERGRRWQVEDFPREPDDDWFWDDRDPVKKHGWFDFRFFPRIATITGAGVGGGSLHYANVSINAQEDLFQEGWPPEITYDDLLQYYKRVESVLPIATIPPNQLSARTRLLKEAAKTGPAKGKVNELDKMLPAYYEMRGWTPDGVPTADTRAKLGLPAQ